MLATSLPRERGRSKRPPSRARSPYNRLRLVQRAEATQWLAHRNRYASTVSSHRSYAINKWVANGNAQACKVFQAHLT